jgi:peptidoglycan/xylan/chitin deacetylase (PgdA/CDA1 family)
MKKFFKIILNVCFLFVVTIASVAFLKKDTYIVPVIMYHHINYSQVRKADTVSPQSLELQMDFLKRHKYNVISLDDYVKAKQLNQRLPRKTAVITFDDGYEDNYIHGFKILEKYGYKATFFIPFIKVGDQGRMNWDQIRELVVAGHEIGSHTYYESYLPELRLEDQRFEIVESKKGFEEKLGVPMEHFCYPSGGFSRTIKKIVKEAGYLSSSATNRGYDKENHNLYEINRIRLNENNKKDYDLAIKLSGYYNHSRKMKRPY